MPDWPTLCAELNVPAATPRRIAGGDTDAAWQLGELFVKTAAAADEPRLRSEFDALSEIAATGAVRVPEAVAVGVSGSDSYLALEWLLLTPSTEESDALLGEHLAALHRCTSEQHGWHRDNAIGKTPQANPYNGDWIAFFRDHRLAFQLKRAEGASSELQRRGERLLERLATYFDEAPVPSLLHGDLWGGNHAVCHGEPVIFDPASYYGDRETDLAMTELFGGFSKSFYTAYQSAWPLDDGYRQRRPLYQLYHVLNHYNLFGGGYLPRALALMDELL